MFEDYYWAVVEGGGVVGDGVDDGVEGGGDGSAGFGEEVDAEMNGATFVGGIGGAGEKSRGIKGARLVVTADAYGDVAIAKRGTNFWSGDGFDGIGRIGAEQGAGDTEIEYEAVLFAQIVRSKSSGGWRIFCERFLDRWRVRNCG